MAGEAPGFCPVLVAIWDSGLPPVYPILVPDRVTPTYEFGTVSSERHHPSDQITFWGRPPWRARPRTPAAGFEGRTSPPPLPGRRAAGRPCAPSKNNAAELPPGWKKSWSTQASAVKFG